MIELTQLRADTQRVLDHPTPDPRFYEYSRTVIALIDLAEKTLAFHSLALAMDTADDTPIIDTLALLGLHAR